MSNSSSVQPTIAVLPPREGSSESAATTTTAAAMPVPLDDSCAAAATTATSASALTPPDTSNDAALAASLQEAEGGLSAPPPMQPDSSAGVSGAGMAEHSNSNNKSYRVATASSPWQYDDLNPNCYGCGTTFTALNRRHHCRLCGHVFCNSCTPLKALIPPSRIVLHPRGGKKAKPTDHAHVSFSPDPDPDRMLTYVASSSSSQPSSHTASPTAMEPSLDIYAPQPTALPQTPPQQQPEPEQLLYGKGLEERFTLAREPIRVCNPCHTQLAPHQPELRQHNSHAVRFNHVDPTDVRRLWNSPYAGTLGHEIRKAAYTLNNLLPQPKRRVGAVLEYPQYSSLAGVAAAHPTTLLQSELQECRDTCSGVSPNLGDLDGVRIPAKLLEHAKGIATLTVLKGGFGLAGAEFGTGLVVARVPSPDGMGSAWSAPSAIGVAGLSWGALLGAQVSDHVFLLMTDAAVNLMFSNTASVQLGADVGVAVGPLGRAVEGDWGVGASGGDRNGPTVAFESPQAMPAPIYTYSLSKGLYAGVSLDGKVICSRPNVNEKFYGYRVASQDILRGAVPNPPAAQPLYEALQRCHVYAAAATPRPQEPNHHHTQQIQHHTAAQQQQRIVDREYGEVPLNVAETAFHPDQQIHDGSSMAGLSDITSEFSTITFS